MDKENILIKNTMPVKDFCNLRESVNFQKLTEQQAEKVLRTRRLLLLLNMKENISV